jgi:hypothetical protein
MFLGMTTTYDDADLFSDAFTGFRGVSRSPQHSRLLTALTMAAAALLVVGALVWVRLDQAVVSQAADPVSLVPVLAESQRTADVIPASERADLLVDPRSTRLLLADDTASYYVASSPGNQLCLVSIPVGDLAQTVCESTAIEPSVLRIDGVALVPTGATAPAGWHEAAANVFVTS